MSASTTVAVLIGVGGYMYFGSNTTNQDLGSYNSPEEAFAATQEVLNLLSHHVNTGIESVQYVQEYEDSKHLIFK